MSRDEAFDILAGLGIDLVKLEFSGGNDEGGTDNTEYLQFSQGDTESMSFLPEEQKVLDDLQDTLEEPITEEWGGFNGDTRVYGTLTWDVQKRQVWIDNEYTDWVIAPRKEV